MTHNRQRIVLAGIILLVLGCAWLAFPAGSFRGAGLLRTHLPLRSAYAAELANSGLPLWTPLLYGGYPLLADPQMGALYPPHLLLYRLLPVTSAFCVLLGLHLLWAALGFCLLAARQVVRRGSALVAALVYCLALALVARFGPASALACLSWLPWLLLLTGRLAEPSGSLPAARQTSLLALTAGMTLLAGPPRRALLCLLAAAAYGAYLSLARGPRRRTLPAVLLLAGLLAGAALASVQLLPMLELERLSVRPAALDPAALPALPRSALSVRPRSLPFLAAQTGIYRILTQEKDGIPASGQVESYSSNLSLVWGLPTASGLASLVPARYARYTAGMTSAMLNLLGVKYYLLPQDSTAAAYDLNDPFLYSPLNDVLPTGLRVAAGFELEWYLSDSAELRDGEPVAVFDYVTEESVDLNENVLTVGSHVADWAYDRSDVRAVVAHNQPAIARTFPARSGSPPEDHVGYVYRAVVRLPYAVLVNGLQMPAILPPDRIHVERATMIDGQGHRHLLSHLKGLGDHTLVYRSEDVAIFENHDVLPRLFLAYEARPVPDDAQALALLHGGQVDLQREVLLAAAEVAPARPPTAGTERVALAEYSSRRVAAEVEVPADGYLVLTDSWYPGWRVSVDGRDAPLLRADFLFRAVYLTAGEHRVEFTYQPESFRTGGWISAAAAVFVVALWLWGGKKYRLVGA
ncbi:MAG TPA: YfhO family protein [Anaerolineae bacterium]|nr:YfhO family protein [Anaerolineae bacterium]